MYSQKPGDPDITVLYDEPPLPVGGFRAIQKNLRYPELARKSGRQGNVIVHTEIDENGYVSQTNVMESLGEALDQAAIDAIHSVKWQPGLKDEKPVKCWIAVLVVFRLGRVD
jgi:protein TonB